MPRKQQQPINKESLVLPEEIALEALNTSAGVCRAMEHGIQREMCFITQVIPLMNQLQAWGYSVEWDVDKRGYMLVEMQKGEGEWVHPTIRRR